MNNSEKQVSKKQISINMIANILSYSSNLVISFVLTPFLINSLGKDVYSFYPLANNFVSYLSIITSALNTMASRYITIEITKGNLTETNKFYSSVLASNVVISAMIMIPMAFIIMFLDSFLHIPINSLAAIRTMFILVFASAIVNIVGSIFGIATFAKNRIDLRSINEVVCAMLRLGLYVLFYTLFQASIIYIGVITFTVTAVGILIQFCYTRWLLPEVRLNINDVSFKHTLRLLSSTSWNIVFSLGNMMLSGMTLLLMNMLYSANESGSLSIVQTVPTFINGVISLLVGIFFPVITVLYAKNDKEGVIQQVQIAQKIIATVGCATIAVFSGLATEFFSLWVPKENAIELSILSMVTIFPHLFIACTWILSNLNIAMNKVKIPAIFTLAIGAINVLLALVVKKIFDMPFITIQVVSTMLQVIWAGVFLPLYASSEMGVSRTIFFEPLLKALGASGICLVLTCYVKKIVLINSWGRFVFVGGLLGGFALIFIALVEFGMKKILLQCSIWWKKVF